MFEELDNTAIAILPRGDFAEELKASACAVGMPLIVYHSVAEVALKLGRQVVVVLLHADFKDDAEVILEEAKALNIVVRVLGDVEQGDTILELLRMGARGFIPLTVSAAELIEKLHASFDVELERHIETSRIGKAKLELEAVFDAYPTPLFVVAPDGIIRRANAGAMVLTRKRKMPELIGKHFWSTLNITNEEQQVLVKDLILRHEDANLDIELNDDTLIRLECFASSPADGFASALSDGILISVRDITKIIEKERQEIHSQQVGAVTLLAATLSHEINQPLGTILGRAQLALMGIDAGELDKTTLKRDLCEIVTAVKRIGKILKKVHSVTEIVEMTYLGDTKMLDLEKSIDGVKDA